jgi:hypothetical protein
MRNPSPVTAGVSTVGTLTLTKVAPTGGMEDYEHFAILEQLGGKAVVAESS